MSLTLQEEETWPDLRPAKHLVSEDEMNEFKNRCTEKNQGAYVLPGSVEFVATPMECQGNDIHLQATLSEEPLPVVQEQQVVVVKDTTKTIPIRTQEPRAKLETKLTGTVRTNYKHPIYAVAWSNDIYSQNGTFYRCCATVGGPNATIYEIEIPNPNMPVSKHKTSGQFVLQQGYYDANRNFQNQYDEWYACAFGGRSFTSLNGARMRHSCKRVRLQGAARNSNNDHDSEEEEEEIEEYYCPPLNLDLQEEQEPDGPEFLCVGGKFFHIQVIDTARRQLWMTLSGHGDEITSLQFSPADCHMLLSASNDRSCRIWNVKNGTNVAILAGHGGHQDIVMFASWHCTGQKVVSSGHDLRVKIWDLGPGTDIAQRIDESYQVQLQMCENQITVEAKTHFAPTVCQFPIHSTNHGHINVVDCVYFLGDLVLSKDDRKIVLWEPDYTPRDGNPKVEIPPPNGLIALRTIHIRGKGLDLLMFYRFSVSPNLRHVAVGNADAEVLIYDIEDFHGKHDKRMDCDQRTKTMVRMTAFSPDGRMLLACSDDGGLWKWDCFD